MSNIIGYVIVDGQRYFCGMGNTRRTAEAAAVGNARMVGQEIGNEDLQWEVKFTRNQSFVSLPPIYELIS